ncbi:MAG: peptidase U32 family protein [Candidatus Micrarchaeia archaeon]
MIELLAPAGSPSALKAAVEAGADAVYMGSNWNARLRARNFTREELAKAISYCHNNNVKAYIALNTLIFEEEIKGVKEYLEFLDKNEADAIIVQDLGVVRLARELNFSFDIHASTQMSVHNSNTAKLLKERGIKRIILARELTFDQIKRIKENVNVELEMFVFGALCYSYSGKCLWSYIQTGRSGNRGACSQMCRFPWKLLVNGKEIKKGYLTSTKDLNLINHIDKIKDLGIESIKIEGRLKDANYIGKVVSTFRAAIDGKDINLDNLESNRGFTTGYLFNEAKNKLINPKSQIFRGKEIGKVLEVKRDGAVVYLNQPLSVNDFIRTSSIGKAIKIYRIYKDGKETNTGIGKCVIKIKGLRKNDKIYLIEPINDDSSFLDEYQPKHKSNQHNIKSIILEPLRFKPNIFIHYTDIDYSNGKNGKIYDWEFAIKKYKEINQLSPVYIETPRVVFDEELEEIKDKISEINQWFLDKRAEHYFVISELSLIGKEPTYVSHYANITNTLAAREWLDIGNDSIKGIIASIELRKEDALKLGFSVYEGNYIELAISENDWYEEFNINGKAQLVDPRGNVYEIKKIKDRTIIAKRRN